MSFSTAFLETLNRNPRLKDVLLDKAPDDDTSPTGLETEVIEPVERLEPAEAWEDLLSVDSFFDDDKTPPETPPMPSGHEYIRPPELPRLADVWMSRDAETMLGALRLLLGNDMAQVPDFVPLAVIRGEHLGLYRFRRTADFYDPSAKLIDASLPEVLLSEKETGVSNLIVITLPHPHLAADRMIFVPPLFRDLDESTLRPWIPDGLRVRRWLWFEPAVGRIAGDDVHQFLTSLDRSHSVHVIMRGLRKAQGAAISTDAGNPLSSALAQLSALRHGRFQPWLHASF